jgi:hypothetical protein
MSCYALLCLAAGFVAIAADVEYDDHAPSAVACSKTSHAAPAAILMVKIEDGETAMTQDAIRLRKSHQPHGVR